MNLEIKTAGKEIAVYVDGLCVWEGSLSDWSKAIVTPGFKIKT